MLEAHIRSEDVNRVQHGQAAEIRFAAFMYRTTHSILGKVFYVSPDRLIGRATNQPYHVAMIEAGAKSLARAVEVKLHAGMPAEVYIKGETRTPLQHLAQPATQAPMRAARER
jgi:multidrug efflux pump subunit AcrA (membrane-fusion protein)